MTLGRRIGYVVTGLLLAGCYTLQPVRGVDPAVGTRVAFDINDVGRVALGGAMGPEVAQVEGLLVEKDAGSYLLSVSAIRLLRGGEQVWSGEQVRLQQQYLGSVYERRFSTGRTIALSAVTVGGLAAFLAGVSIVGGGVEDPGNGNCNPEIETCTGQDRIGRP